MFYSFFQFWFDGTIEIGFPVSQTPSYIYHIHGNHGRRFMAKQLAKAELTVQTKTTQLNNFAKQLATVDAKLADWYNRHPQLANGSAPPATQTAPPPPPQEDYKGTLEAFNELKDKIPPEQVEDFKSRAANVEKLQGDYARVQADLRERLNEQAKWMQEYIAPQKAQMQQNVQPPQGIQHPPPATGQPTPTPVTPTGEAQVGERGTIGAKQTASPSDDTNLAADNTAAPRTPLPPSTETVPAADENMDPSSKRTSDIDADEANPKRAKASDSETAASQTSATTDRIKSTRFSQRQLKEDSKARAEQTAKRQQELIQQAKAKAESETKPPTPVAKASSSSASASGAGKGGKGKQ